MNTDRRNSLPPPLPRSIHITLSLLLAVAPFVVCFPTTLSGLARTAARTPLSMPTQRANTLSLTLDELGYEDVVLTGPYGQAVFYAGLPAIAASLVRDSLLSSRLASIQIEMQDALIANPSFEIDDDRDGRPDNWDWPVGDWVWDGSAAHSGDYSARVEKNDDQRSSASLWSDHTLVSPSTNYTLTLWLRTQDATSDPSVSVYQYDAAYNQNTARTQTSVAVGEGTLAWSPVHLRFQTQPDSAFIRVCLYLWRSDNGTFWFDDVDLQAGDVATYPFQAGFPVATDGPVWFSSPSLADLEGNGNNELLVGDGNGRIYAWTSGGNALTGFPYETGDGRVRGPLALGDLTGDGSLEIAAGTRADYDGGLGRVFVIQHDGTLVSDWPKSVAWNTNGSDGRSEVYSTVLADLDSDGDLEVVAGTSNNASQYEGSNPPPIPNLYAWHHSGTSVSGDWPTYYSKAGIFGAVAVGNLSGGSTVEVATGRDHLYLYAYGADGTSLPGWPVTNYYGGPSGTWGDDDYIVCTNSAPILADLEGDGETEYVIAGRLKDGPARMVINSALLILDAEGQRRPGWETPALGAGPPLYDSYHPQQAPVVADLDHDGDLEVIVATFDGYLRVYDHDKTLRWSYDYAQGETRFASEAVVGDVDADGRLEILFGTYDPTFGNAQVGLWALDSTGNVLPGYHLLVASPGIRAAPTLGDLDADGDLEIMAAGLSGHVYVWDTSTRLDHVRLPWPTGRYDVQRSAWFRWSDPNLGPTAKRAQPSAADQGQIVSFTVTLLNIGGPLTGTTRLTDTIPGGLEYISGSLQVSPDLGTAVLDGQTLTWGGDIGNHSPVVISYQTCVVTDSVVALANTVVVDVNRFAPLYRSAMFIANGYTWYLPILFREADP